MRLAVDRIALPILHHYEEIDPFSSICVSVHHTHHFDLLRSKLHPCFLASFPYRRMYDLLAAVQLPRHYTQLAIFIAGIATAEHQQLILADEE